MIGYDYNIMQDAAFDANDTHSQRTGQEFTYPYYCELTKLFRERTLTDDQYYDWEITRFKYDINRKML